MPKDKPVTLDKCDGFVLQQIVERDENGGILTTYFEIVTPTGEVIGPLGGDEPPYSLFEQLIANSAQPKRASARPRM